MFVKNFSRLLIGGSYAEYNTNGSALFAVTGRDGNAYTPSFSCYSVGNTSNNMRVFTANSFAFGDSDSDVDTNQYDIQGTELSLTNKSMTIGYGFNADGTMVLAYKLKGTPSSDGTIKEVGLFKNIYDNSSNVSTSALIYREVLDTPISVTQGVAIELLFKIELIIS